MSSIEQKIDSIGNKLECLPTILSRMDAVEKSLAKLMNLQERLDSHETQIKKMWKLLDYLYWQGEKAESQDKRMNIIISGVPEDPNERTWDDTKNKVLDIFKNKMNLDDIFIQRTHRFGRWSPRKIVVKLRDWDDREKILSNRKHLAGSRIYIDEHFTNRVNDVRKELLNAFRGFKDVNNRGPRLVRDKIWVGQKLYGWNEEDKQPYLIS